MVGLVARLRAIDRKLLRDSLRMRGQALAIAMVAACGIATFVTMQGAYQALLAAKAGYYEQYRFADVFVNVKRAPLSLVEQVRAIPGVNEIHARVVFEASLDVPGLEEPAVGRLVSLPEQPGTGLNRVHLRAGRLPAAGGDKEVLISEAFSLANKLHAGGRLQAIINGRKETLFITGIAISPEYVSEIRGNSFPDNRRFGVLWMARDGLAAALDMRDGFNDLSVTLAPGASEKQVIERLDALLAPYGSLGAYGRNEQISHNFLTSELNQTRVSATVLPLIFLGVAAFLIHNILQRITLLQRPQIALLKSFGYSRMAVGLHYLKFALATVIVGGIIGIAAGIWLGRGLARLYVDFYHFPALEFVLSWYAVTMSLVIAVLAALAGASLAVVRVLRLPPAEATRPEAPARFRPGAIERIGLQRFMPLTLRMVVRNLERNPAKAALSVLGLAMSAALIVTGQFTFDALDEIIRLQFRTSQRDDVTLAFNEVRDRSVVHNLAALPGVLRVEPFRNVPVRLRHEHRSKKTVIIGLDTDRELRTVLDKDERPIALPEDGIVMSAALAKILGASAGGTLTIEQLEGRRRVFEVTISRIIDEPIGAFAYMDLAALARLLQEPVTASGAYLAVDPLHRQRLYRTLKNIPAVGSVSLREATLQSFLETVAKNMVINTLVLITFACIIAMGVVYNSARIALSEHAVELASLRILGFTKREVGSVLLSEQALLTLLALPLGCALGYGLAALLSVLLSQELFRIPLVISTYTFLMAIGVVVVAAALSGWMVWNKVKRLDLIEVLKTRE